MKKCPNCGEPYTETNEKRVCLECDREGCLYCIEECEDCGCEICPDCLPMHMETEHGQEA